MPAVHCMPHHAAPGPPLSRCNRLLGLCVASSFADSLHGCEHDSLCSTQVRACACACAGHHRHRLCRLHGADHRAPPAHHHGQRPGAGWVAAQAAAPRGACLRTVSTASRWRGGASCWQGAWLLPCLHHGHLGPNTWGGWIGGGPRDQGVAGPPAIPAHLAAAAAAAAAAPLPPLQCCTRVRCASMTRPTTCWRSPTRVSAGAAYFIVGGGSSLMRHRVAPVACCISCRLCPELPAVRPTHGATSSDGGCGF